MNGFCNYVHMDEYGRVDKEKARKEEGAYARVAAKRPSDRSEARKSKDSGISEGAGARQQSRTTGTGE